MILSYNNYREIPLSGGDGGVRTSPYLTVGVFVVVVLYQPFAVEMAKHTAREGEA